MKEQPEINHSPQRSPGGLARWLVPVLIFGVILVAGASAWVILRPAAPVAPPDAIPTPLVDGAPALKTQKFELFVPNDDARLSRKTVTDDNLPADAPYSKKAERALELLFPQVKFLPAGLRTVTPPSKDKNGIVHVNLNREFLKLNTAHETPVMLSLDAIARTLGALDSGDGKSFQPAKVLFLVEGKTISTLSEFSLDEPWTVSEPEAASTNQQERTEDAV